MSRTYWTSNRQTRPGAAGEYWVTLDAPETVNVAPAGEPYRFEPTGRMIRTLDMRYLAAPGEDDGWTMDGEDVSDYHWTEQTGSRSGEHVVAWMGPIEPPEVFRGELTDGYKYVWEDMTMSEASEKRYSAKEIADGISGASIACRLVKGPEHEAVIDEFCTVFLIGFLGEDTYRQAMTELMAEELGRSKEPISAVLAALMAGAGRDDDHLS